MGSIGMVMTNKKAVSVMVAIKRCMSLESLAVNIMLSIVGINLWVFNG